MFRYLRDKLFVNPVKGILKAGLETSEKRMLSAMEAVRLQQGRILANQMLAKGAISGLAEVEFKVFSQWNDDGIIQYLIHKIDVKNKVFIEFGVENYRESNTRFLLINDNWRGLVIDGGEENINFIKQEDMYWRQDLTAVCSFITTDNINPTFTANGFQGEIGLLSIDVDGNDFWIWDKINTVTADIVIVEYNSVFGGKNAITVPYDPAFVRSKSHDSNLYWGTSLKALCVLAKKKGYAFVGCNSHGNNAYFIKKEKAGGFKELSSEEGYVESKFRESRDKNGALTFISGNDRLKQIEEMLVFNVETNQTLKIRDLG